MPTDRPATSDDRRGDVGSWLKDRVASQCVCCGSSEIISSPAILMPFVSDRAFGWKPVRIDESWGLRTIENGNAYALCNSLQCQACGHLFCDIRFSDAEMSSLYNKYREEEYTALRDHYEPGYAKRNEALKEPVDYIDEVESFLNPFVEKPLTVLDWGGDTGKNTPFKHQVAEFDIYDISNKEVEPGARLVSLDTAQSRAYRLIVCSMVLEHVPFPADVLLDARKAMDGGSILYIEVPYEDIARIEARDLSVLKRHWHEHINFYSRNSIFRLIENCGLRPVASNILSTAIAGSPIQIFQIACKLQAPAGDADPV